VAEPILLANHNLTSLDDELLLDQKAADLEVTQRTKRGGLAGGSKSHRSSQKSSRRESTARRQKAPRREHEDKGGIAEEEEGDLAIPEYDDGYGLGGEDEIDEDDNEYGSSYDDEDGGRGRGYNDGDRSEQLRLREMVEELQQTTQNLTLEQFSEELRSKINNLFDTVKSLSERFPQSSSTNSLTSLVDEVNKRVDRL
jgi:hypothetical protein